MAVTIRLKISPAVAQFVTLGVSSEEKLKGLGKSDEMTSVDRVMLCCCLMKDPDPVIRDTASGIFSGLAEETLLAYLQREEVHPAILDTIVRVHHSNLPVADVLRGHDALSPGARDFLDQMARVKVPTPDGDPDDADVLGVVEEYEDVSPEPDNDAMEPDEPPEEPVEDSEEFRSKYQLAQTMGIAEKIKMALTGDKEWRAILIKDSNKLVSGGVVKNPRITDGEILSILKVGVQNDDIIRVICANREWIKSAKIRKALVECPKTPLANALRYLATLSEKEIAAYAKSRNISSVLSTQAKRILLNKKR